MHLTTEKLVSSVIPKVLMSLLGSEQNLIMSDNIIHSKDYLHKLL